ncbi:MAG: hypothetical protein HYR94_11600 [Chloroflexi bacterium]|nr:hypothetical protein [Chloroflexota bacterium]
MSSPTDSSGIAARLSEQARVIVGAEAKRHVHALRQLRRYLPDRQIEVVEPESLPTLAENADLLVLLADSAAPVSAKFATLGIIPELPQADDAFVLHTVTLYGRPTLFAIGGGIPGLIHAVNEMGLRRLATRGNVIELPALDVRQAPALPYRLLWTWDHSTNWYLEQVGLQEIGAMNYYSKPEDGFLEDYRRLIDFMSLHRIGGVTIYGFLRDNHGGVEAAQALCRYANERGVRILPGVGINAYGGIYWEGKHRYNLTTWLRQHPELRAIFDQPVAFHIPDFPKLWFPETHYTNAACPSKPENARYHEEAIQWLAETFEIGGINFETGDYGACQCPDCATRRTTDETWSLKDMALLYPRLFEAARRSRPDLWLVSEAYWDNILDLDALAPLADLPDDVIYQFCINRSYWPTLKANLTREHVARLPRSQNVVRTHMGTQWNHERYELIARRLAEMMLLLHTTGMQGATIFSEVSAFSVVNEINYLAFARFGYDAGLTWEKFVADDLGPLLGGAEAADRYLELLAVPADTPALTCAAAEARDIATAQTGEAYRRWVWLQNRLYQKLVMLPA